MGIAIFNHDVVNMEQLCTDINDRGYTFGDGVYEVIRFYDGKFFRLSEHLIRYQRSLREIGISFEFSLEQMKKEFDYLVKESGFRSGYIYTQVTRGIAKRNHLYLDQNLTPQYLAYAVQEEERPLEIMEKGIKVLLTSDIRWLRCDIKSLSLLGSVMLKNKAALLGAKEAVLHRQGHITEGSATNVFMVKEGMLFTHPANHLILKGVTRQAVIDIAQSLQVKVSEVPFSLEFFRTADEAFTTASVSEITPITEYELDLGEEKYLHGIIGNQTRGPLTEKIQEVFTTLIRKKEQK